MKKMFAAMMAALILSACSPQGYTMLVERRYPSPSGLDISGKSACVVYLDNGSMRDSLFSSSLSDGLAQGLEAQFFDGERTVPVFSLHMEEGADYASRDTVLNLIMETGKDVLFLLDEPVFAENSDGDLSGCARLYVYDSMYKADKVLQFSGTGAVSSGDNLDMMVSDAQYMGYNMAQNFKIKWKEELHTVIYYSNMESFWLEALDAADEMRWSDAVGIWLNHIDTSDYVKYSCLAYNIALGCYMLDEYDLAAEWLDKSEKVQPMSLSKGLRERVLERMKL